MKRDMDLIRGIALELEAFDMVSFKDGSKLNTTAEDRLVISEHLDLMREAGLIESDIVGPADRNAAATHRNIRLTWDGHEFLDAARDDGIWNEAQDRLAEVGGASLSIMISLLTEMIKDKLGMGGDCSP